MMHSLQPFQAQGNLPTIAGSIEFSKDYVTIHFTLNDDSKQILHSLKPMHWTAENGARADGLWQTTCFEAFWTDPNARGYWELNVSPRSAQWNLYRFEAYRLPQPPTPSFDFELIEVNCSESTLLCRLQNKTPVSHFKANLCAVVRLSTGTLYYSVQHAPEKPDFHDLTSMRL